MIHVRNTRLSGLVLATAFATSMMAGPAASAAGDETFNNADLRLRGGDPAAVAACVNFAKTWLSYDDAKQKKNERKRIAQSNFCENKAKAVGGDVTLKDVDILVTQKGKHRATRNDATLTASGGDAIAVAACLNVLVGSATTVKQQNDCTNTAVAVGGDVTLQNVFIDIEQS